MSATTELGGRRISLAAVLALFFTLFAVSTASAARPDFDGDGATTTDCAPLDPAVHPGAVDKPDLNFEDTNCDGIDGDKAKAIFVSPTAANNNGPGSVTSPKATLGGAQGAIATALAAHKDVYMAGGTYNETALLEDNVGLYGGYEALTGRRDGELTTIKGAPAVLASGDSGVVLQLLTLDGQPDGDGNAYGIRAVKDGADPSRLVLQRVTATGAAAAAGGNLGNGGNGGNAVGFLGGFGGVGGCGLGVIGAPGGAGFNNGAPGASGASGGNNALLLPDTATWPRPRAAAGGGGFLGGSGNGGTGGFGNSGIFGIAICGGTGGRGGLGGGGGTGGSGGQNGGGSFGAYLLDSSIAAVGSTLAGGAGGVGGSGGNRGLGGAGGGGFAGDPGLCLFGTCAFQGFTGGPGASGGNGGSGGGGVGGPSTGVYQAGAGSGFAPRSGTTETMAPAAASGGAQGNGGPVAPGGQRAAVLRSGSAPATSTADFDGDGVNDSADACPEAARGTNGSANGCPVRAAKLADSDGDGVPNNRDACPTQASTEANDANNDGCVDPTGGGGGGGGGGTGGGGGGPTGPSLIPSTVTNKWLAFPNFTKASNLSVNNLLASTTVKVTCKTKAKKQQKKSCPYKSKTVTTAVPRAKLNLIKPFKKKKLPIGTKITITITTPGQIGKQIRFTVRKRAVPKVSNLCVPPGGKPGQCV